MSDWAKVALLTFAVFLLWLLALPVAQGYHIGCDAFVDHLRLVRVGIEWCK